MKTFVDIDIANKGNYLKLLTAISKLSGLFSESSTPFINYRVVENIFCKCFKAKNLSRSDTAFDANFNSCGIGLKTFICPKNNKTEKIAEFNLLSKTLSRLKDKALAIKLAELRNERMSLANRLYGIDHSLYHIVARREKELLIFETDYKNIDIANISTQRSNTASLQFDDGENLYSYNYSKSTLFRKFNIPQNAYRMAVEIIDNPYDLLLELTQHKTLSIVTDKLIRGINYIILPLYGFKNNQKYVFEKSGLNQWNANGRKRNLGEVYISIPAAIHKLFPEFFPSRDEYFNLQVPTGEVFSAKICQDNSKALMTNPNKALSDWLLRKVFQLREGELATLNKMNQLGFDSVIIIKENSNNYKIDKAKLDSYTDFIKIK